MRSFFSYLNCCISQKWSIWLEFPWSSTDFLTLVTGIQPCYLLHQPLPYPSVPSMASALLPELFKNWSLSPFKTWICSLPLTSPKITYLLLIWIETTNPGLTVTFYQGNCIRPVCLVIPRHSPSLCVGFLPVTGALRSSLPRYCTTQGP